MSQKPPSTRRMIREFLRPWWRSPLALLTATALILAAGRIALDPWLTAKVRGNLTRLATTGVVVAFRDLQVSLFPPSIALTDLTFQGQSGESMDVDRLVVQVASLRELAAATPHVRLHIVRPHWRTFPGASDLDRLRRAMPAAHVDVASFANGSVGNSAGGDGRPVLGGMHGTVEGLATGAEIARQRWKISADGYLAALNPVHVTINHTPAGKWETSFSVRGLAWAASLDGLPFSIAGHVDSGDFRFKAVVRVSGLPNASPTARTHDSLAGLSQKWPTTDVTMTETLENPGTTGQEVNLVILEEVDKSRVHGFRPQDGIGVVVSVVGLAAKVLIVPATSTAVVIEDDSARPQRSLAVNMGGNHETD